MQAPHPNDPRYIDWLVKLAEANRAQGVIEEPRLFWDVVTLRDEDPLVTDYTGNVFENGEQFPVRLTHVVMAPRPAWGAESPFSDERLIQRVSLRLRFHDTFYMNNLLLPAPLWVNKTIAAPASVSQGSAHWILDRPVILSARDTLSVEVQPETNALDADTTYNVAVSFTGVGLLSKRPYFFGSSKQFTDANVNSTQFTPTDMKNDGTEPIAITDVGFTVDAGDQVSTNAGDVRRWRFQIRQIGNGTQRTWFFQPTGETLCPGQLLGISQGRAIVHRFPGDGMIWQPGEGVQAQAAALTSGTEGMDFLLGFAGYIAIK